MMRYNAYKTDPLAVNPIRTPVNGISARADLANTNVTYPFSDIAPACFGGIDSKIVSNAFML